MLTSYDWLNAYRVLDACNLSGVAHDFSEVVRRVRDSLGDHASTDDVNRHPICVMYAEKIAQLTGLGTSSLECFSKAYAEVRRKIEEKGGE